MMATSEVTAVYPPSPTSLFGIREVVALSPAHQSDFGTYGLFVSVHSGI